VVSTLNKKIIRDMRDHWAQFLAITMVILCGVSSLAAMKGASQSLRGTRDTYYAGYGMADMWTYVERAPQNAVAKVRALPSVLRARGRIEFDVSVDAPDSKRSVTARIVSVPAPNDDEGKAPRTGLLDLCMSEGRYFVGDEQPEVIVERQFAEANGLRPGVTFKATLNDRKTELRVVGIAQSPEFIYTIRGLASYIPDPKSFGILWMSEKFAEKAFNFEGAANRVVLTLSRGANKDAVKKALEQILSPYGYITTLTQDEHISSKMLGDEIEQGAKQAEIMPTIFLSVAALVLAIMMTRMVRNQRTQMGVLMAMGYTKARIVAHYLSISLIVGISGAAGGLALGFAFAGEMTKLYKDFFSFPSLAVIVPANVVTEGFLIGAVFSTAGGLFAVSSLLRMAPAEALRPETPSSAAKVLLEHFRGFWRALPFPWKMILRYIGRHKIRVCLAILGIALATSIVMSAFIASDSMNYVQEHQFTLVQKEDIKVDFFEARDARSSLDLAHLEGVKRSEPILEVYAEVSNGWRKKNITITGMDGNADLRRILARDGKRLSIPRSGLLLERRAAELLGVGIGDSVTVKALLHKMDEKRVVITGLVEQHLGLNAYMQLDELSRLVGERRVASGVLLEAFIAEIPGIEKKLKDVPAVVSSEPKAVQQQMVYDAFLKSKNIMFGMMMFFAAVISFAVIYTMTTIAIDERSRELASLRVIGLTVDEVAAILFNENFMVSMLGIAAGLVLGVLESILMMAAFETDMYRFPSVIKPYTYVVTILIVFAFVMFSNWVCYNRIRNLSMVEVMKTRE